MTGGHKVFAAISRDLGEGGLHHKRDRRTACMSNGIAFSATLSKLALALKSQALGRLLHVSILSHYAGYHQQCKLKGTATSLLDDVIMGHPLASHV